LNAKCFEIIFERFSFFVALLFLLIILDMAVKQGLD